MTNIFVNVPTADLERAQAFYLSLGATLNPLFTDENAACIDFGDGVYFMVLTKEYFATFTEKTVVDPKTHVVTLISLSRESREEVDRVLEAGLATGGTEPTEPQDFGFMYSRDLEDPDGNGIQFMFMEPQAAEKGPDAFLAENAQA